MGLLCRNKMLVFKGTRNVFLMSVVPVTFGPIWPWFRTARWQFIHGSAAGRGPLFADPCFNRFDCGFRHADLIVAFGYLSFDGTVDHHLPKRFVLLNESVGGCGVIVFNTALLGCWIVDSNLNWFDRGFRHGDSRQVFPVYLWRHNIDLGDGKYSFQND